MGGTLEVLLVSAEGIGHTNIIGKPTYYVILECANQAHKSKPSKGHEEIFWNEKFIFELPKSGMHNQIYLKLKIMDEELFSHGGFVGETTIYLKGIITEGKDKGMIEVKPAPYNVVLDNDTFKGEIRIGLKYTTNHIVQQTQADDQHEEKEGGHSLCRSIVSFWQIPWWRFLFRCKSFNSIDKHKRN